MFKDISTFDAQNPIVGFLLKELNLGKRDIESTLIKRPGAMLMLKYQIDSMR